MAEIHDGLAGRWQILLRNLVKPFASLHNQSRPAQHCEVFGGVVVAGTGDFGHFINRSRLARAQFLEHFPTRRMTERAGQSFQIRQRRSNGDFRCFRCRIHAKQPVSLEIQMQVGNRYPANGLLCSTIGLCNISSGLRNYQIGFYYSSFGLRNSQTRLRYFQFRLCCCLCGLHCLSCGLIFRPVGLRDYLILRARKIINHPRLW